MNTDQTTVVEKPSSLLMMLSLALVVINTLLTYVVQTKLVEPEKSFSFVHWYALVGRSILGPLFMVLLFQVGKRFRTRRARVEVFFWFSVATFFLTLGSLAPAG